MDKRSYVEVDSELNYQLKLKAVQERTSIRQLVTDALLRTYPELKGDNNGTTTD